MTQTEAGGECPVCGTAMTGDGRCLACAQDTQDTAAFDRDSTSAYSTLDRQTAQRLEIGRQIGRFRLLALLGEGGFATVYRAEDLELGREVALKLLHPHLAVDAAFVRRFRAEARAAARLRHPNIVTIHDVGTTEDGRTYLVMELLHGTLLSTLIRAHAPLSSACAASIIAQLASALDYLHQRDLVHRDVKPQNIMVDEKNDVTLMDFGIAHSRDEQANLTQQGKPVGTPAYMAPEQIRGTPVGPATDIYALGIVAYELYSGRLPFHGSPADIMHQQLSSAPPPIQELNPGLPDAVGRALAQALAKDPAARPATAAAFAILLPSGSEPYLTNTLAWTPTAPPHAEPRLDTGDVARPRASKLPRRIMLEAAAVLLLVVLVLLLLRGRSSGTSARATPAAGAAAASAPSPTGSTAAAPSVQISADDDAARARIPEAEQDVAAVLAALSRDDGLVPPRPLTIFLEGDEAAARARLVRFGRTPASIDSFFAGKIVITSAATQAGLEYLIYLPNTTDLRGNIAFGVASYALRTIGGGLDRTDAYPYWFLRGFQTSQRDRFSEKNSSALPAAVKDGKTGTAPPLGRIASDVDAQSFITSQSDGAARLDARGEAALEYLTQTYGEAATGRLIKENAFGSIIHFNEVLRQITGQSLDQFNSALDVWLQRK